MMLPSQNLFNTISETSFGASPHGGEQNNDSLRKSYNYPRIAFIMFLQKIFMLRYKQH